MQQQYELSSPSEQEEQEEQESESENEEPQPPPQPNALDAIDQQERQGDEATRVAVEAAFRPKMVLNRYEPQQIKNVTLTALRYEKRVRMTGTPCIVVGAPHLLVGTTASEVALVRNGEVALLLRPTTFVGGAVTALDANEVFCVSGYEHGQLAVWDVQSGALLKTLVEHERPIVALRFTTTNRFLTADTSVLMRTTVNRVLWSYVAERDALQCRGAPVYQVEVSGAWCALSQEDGVTVV